MAKEDEMITITEAAVKTGVSVDTLRAWARTGRLIPAQRIEVKGVLTWHTTINAVRAVLSNPPKSGRPVRMRNA